MSSNNKYCQNCGKIIGTLKGKRFYFKRFPSKDLAITFTSPEAGKDWINHWKPICKTPLDIITYSYTQSLKKTCRRK